MCQCPRRVSCAAMGCLIIPTLPPWQSAAQCWGNRRERSLRVWTGRRCVRSVERPIPSGVPPAGSCWCAPGSSRGEGRRHLRWLGSVQLEVHTAGRPRPRVWCAWRQPGGSRWRSLGRLWVSAGHGTCSPVPQGRLLVGAPGRMAEGEAGSISIACQGDTSSEQVGTRSVQPGVEASPGRPRSEARTWFGGGQAQLNS